MNNHIDPIPLTVHDIQAILCALPLATYIDSGSPAQDELTLTACNSIVDKISNQSAAFAPKEILVISSAISTAKQFLSGTLPELSDILEPDEKADLAMYLFTYNRLCPVFDGLADKARRILA